MNPDPDEHAHPGQEDMHWGTGIREAQRDKKPSSKYWTLSEQARKIIPGESQCRMFCGGKVCKYCTPENWKTEQMVIDGLYSEWVTDNIIAMARMSTENIDKFKMIDQFTSMGIKTVVNLQQSGEHAFCGHGIESSGFSYDPQQFMKAGFFFYNFAMGDYGVASMQKLLDIVKVIQFAVSQGKVAIHCHAGLGRTGLIIACYLIYTNRVRAGKSVQYVRSRRAGAIQTKEQVNTCHQFEEYLKLFYVIFPSRIPDSHSFSFNQFLNRQQNLLHGYEGRKLKHVPKIIYVCCERLLELCGRGQALSSLRHGQENKIKEDLSAVGNSDSTLSVYDEFYKSEYAIGDDGKNEDCISSNSELKPTNSNNKCTEEIFGLSRRKITYTGKAGYTEEAVDAIGNDSSDDNDYTDKHWGHVWADNSPRDTLVLDIEDVCSAIIMTDYSAEVSEEIEKIEVNLNKSDEMWGYLAKQSNPLIVCGVMWDWLDCLYEPILRVQDVYTLIEHSNEINSALSRLEKSTKHFLEYVTRVFGKLEPVSPTTLHSVVKRFLCHLTQKKHGNFDNSSNSYLGHMTEEKPDVSSLIFELFMKMISGEKDKD